MILQLFPWTKGHSRKSEALICYSSTYPGRNAKLTEITFVRIICYVIGQAVGTVNINNIA